MTLLDIILKPLEDPRLKTEAALKDPAFSHTRRGDGCWRDVVWIYHFDANSPSGVRLAHADDVSVVELMQRALQNNSPLSPTEGRY